MSDVKIDSQAEYRLLIAGSWHSGASGTYDIINPATENLVGQAPAASASQSEMAADAAAEAFKSWSKTKPEYRAELLNRAADLLDERTEELWPLVQAETGATRHVAKTMQVPQVAARLRRYARGALESTSIPLDPVVMPATPLAPGGLINARVRRAPVGAVACITSYNFPMVNMAGKIGPALAMGNSVVVKPAPQDPLGVIKLVEILNDAGFPEGVINVITAAAPEPSEALVAAKGIDMISFTGSTVVGERIASVAGSKMKRVLMELGGKGACIVFDDADLRAAIGGISSVWAFHSGQICTAPTRVLVHKSQEQNLIAGLKMAAERLTVGDPLDPSTIVGPLITGVHRDRVEGYIATARDEGGDIAVGGDRGGMQSGYFVAPTLVAGCTPEMTVVREEIFGPVVVVVPFEEEDEAVELANSGDFGLYDYVFSADTSKAMRVAEQLRTGNVGINTLQRHHEAAFGGFKRSGVGRDGGSFGLHAYSEMQSVIWTS